MHQIEFFLIVQTNLHQHFHLFLHSIDSQPVFYVETHSYSSFYSCSIDEVAWTLHFHFPSAFSKILSTNFSKNTEIFNWKVPSLKWEDFSMKNRGKEVKNIHDFTW